MPFDDLDSLKALARLTIRVNGAFMGRLAYHPKTGEVVVPPGNWYIWPTMKTVVNRMVRQEVISEVIAGRALVSEKQIIGRPFETWFGRKQILR